MLVLECREGESIRVGESQITVVKVQSKKGWYFVRLGIDALPEIPVHREKIYQRLKQQGQARPVRHRPAGSRPA